MLLSILIHRAAPQQGICCCSVADSFETPRTVARQAALFMEFSRQDYKSGLPFPSPEDLPDPGIESVSPALAGGFFNTEPSGKPQQGITRSLLSEVLSRGNSGLEGFAAPSQF